MNKFNDMRYLLGHIQKERWILFSILSAVLLIVVTDVVSDFKEGVQLGHLLLECSAALFSMVGIFYVLKDFFKTKNKLVETNQNFILYRQEAEKWRAESKKFLDGLSTAIDRQLEKWELTSAEKEVAFLLLKGLSSKEIANVRNTTEKTARTQSMAIYAKAGLSGRSELSAFFLEDLLVPHK